MIGKIRKPPPAVRPGVSTDRKLQGSAGPLASAARSPLAGAGLPSLYERGTNVAEDQRIDDAIARIFGRNR